MKSSHKSLIVTSANNQVMPILSEQVFQVLSTLLGSECTQLYLSVQLVKDRNI